MDGYKQSLMAIGYNNDFKVNSELSDVRNADDASHAAKIVIIALSSMLVTTLIVNIWCWWIVMTVLLIILGL